MDSFAVFDTLWREFDTILVLLARPIVQRQLIAFITVVLVCGVLSAVVNRFWDRSNRNDEEDLSLADNLRRNLLYPVVALVALAIVIQVFRANAYAVNFLLDSQSILWGFLAYRLLTAAFDMRFSRRWADVLRRQILLPLLFLAFFFFVVGNFININVVGQVRIATIFEQEYTIANGFFSALALYIVFVIVSLLQSGQRYFITLKTENTATISSIFIVIRYAVLVIGLLVVASSLGLNLTTLAVIGGGLSVGIGFGLQQIIANFISGIILLFEQSLRPGDVIDLNGQLGQVKQINMRSTSVLTRENVEIVVPNEHFLTTDVTTYTKNNPLIRLAIPFGVSYQSDPHQVRDLAIEAAKKHKDVKLYPQPQVHFVGFGASSLDFDLLIWIEKPILMLQIKSDLYFLLWDVLAEHEIEIPFPQTDLHLRSGWEQIGRDRHGSGDK